MKIFVNQKKVNDFLEDRDGNIRTPMYFEKLSYNAKNVFKIILEYGGTELDDEVIDGLMKRSFGDAIVELCENDYLNVFK